MTKKGQYQIELWEECNSRCSFCYLGNNNKQISDIQKIQNLNNAINRISNDALYEYVDCLGFIGGEFFQGQLRNEQVKEKFLALMTIASKKLIEQKICEVWISASLLIGNHEDLYQTLDIFSSNIDKIWLLTSYDTIGRFHSDKQKLDWIQNIQKIKNKYPTINVNITSIVSGDFIERYISKTLDLFEIAGRFNCSCFLKPTARIAGFIDDKIALNQIIPDFFPSRAKMLKFLMQFKMNEPSFMYDKLFNMSCRASYLELYGHRQKFAHRIKANYQEELDEGNDISNQMLPCGHSVQYQCYVDSDKCLICDKQTIQQMNV